MSNGEPRVTVSELPNGYSSFGTPPPFVEDTPRHRWPQFSWPHFFTRQEPASPVPKEQTLQVLVKSPIGVTDLVSVTLPLFFIQLLWTLQLSHGTPTLLALNLSSASTALVWLAGPFAGIVVQPLVGMWGDTRVSKHRRSAVIFLSMALLSVSLLFISFSRPISRALVTVVEGILNLVGGGGVGDWDPNVENRRVILEKSSVIAGFWGMDLGINGVQAGVRALMIDKTPPSHLSTVNAYHSRLTALGNILGYTLCSLPLGAASATSRSKNSIIGYLERVLVILLSPLGGTAFRKLAILMLLMTWACLIIQSLKLDEILSLEERVLTVPITKLESLDQERVESLTAESVEHVLGLPFLGFSIIALENPVRQNGNAFERLLYARASKRFGLQDIPSHPIQSVFASTTYEGDTSDEDSEYIGEGDVSSVTSEPSLVFYVRHSFNKTHHAIKAMPKQMKRACLTQCCAWIGIFPYLFYSTTYITQTHLSHSPYPTPEQLSRATELGSQALGWNSILSLIVSTVGGWLTAREGGLVGLADWLGTTTIFSRRVVEPEVDESTSLVANSRPKIVHISEWRTTLARFLRQLHTYLTLRNVWTFGLVWFILCIMGTFWVDDGTWKEVNFTSITVMDIIDKEGTRTATVRSMWIIGLLGISWGIFQWVPYALVMEAIKEKSRGTSRGTLEGSSSRVNHINQEENISATPLPFRSQPVAPNPVGRGLPQSSKHLVATRSVTFIPRHIDSEPPAPRRKSGSVLEARNREDSQSIHPYFYGTGTFGRRDGLGVSEQLPQTGRRCRDDKGVLVFEVERREELSSSFSLASSGLLLGIHNLAIVFPQLVTSLLSYLLLKALEKHNQDRVNNGLGCWDVGWVLRAGAFVMVFSVFISRWVL